MMNKVLFGKTIPALKLRLPADIVRFGIDPDFPKMKHFLFGSVVPPPQNMKSSFI